MDYEYWGGGNELDRIVDPRGYSITLDYDSSERITSISYNAYRSSKTTWTYTYNSGNTVVADPLGYDTTYYYDGNGRVTETVNAEGDSVGSTWDANNNQTAILDPTGQVTTLVYGSLNNLTSRQNPDLDNGDPGAATTYEYADPNHPYEPSKKTDPSGNTVAYSYNVNGQLASKAGSASDGTATGTFTYAYQGDPNGSSGTVDCGAMTGQLCSKTDARGNTTTFSYDTDGNVTTITPPGPVGQKTYTYDALSRVKTITDGNGSKLTVTYDGADRPISVTYADTGATVPYAYDAAGNLLTRNDSVGGQTTWEYDGYNRITKVKQSGKPAITYSYDAAGNLTTESGPAGTTAYTYDTANQIDHITKPNNKTYAYVYQDGRPTRLYMPGGIKQTMGYDNAGRLTSIKAVRDGTTALTDFTASYVNAAGEDTNLMQTESNNVAGITNTYTYDGLSRLTAVNGSGAGSDDYTFSYDKNGNMMQESKNGIYSAFYGYNAANQLATDGGAPSGTYDNAGNQTSTGTGLSMQYNARNQTTQFTPPGGSGINIGYNGVGQVVRTQNGNTAQLNGALGLYSDTQNGTSTHYTHLPTGSGRVISQTTGSNSYTYLTDLRGSVVKLADENGNIKAHYAYSPYGQTTTLTGTADSAFRYAGGYYDVGTKLYRFGARYYNPEEARWTQLDPSGREYGYVYANANPVNFVDRSGHFPLTTISAPSLLEPQETILYQHRCQIAFGVLNLAIGLATKGQGARFAAGAGAVGGSTIAEYFVC